MDVRRFIICAKEANESLESSSTSLGIKMGHRVARREQSDRFNTNSLSIGS